MRDTGWKCTGAWRNHDEGGMRDKFETDGGMRMNRCVGQKLRKIFDCEIFFDADDMAPSGRECFR